MDFYKNFEKVQKAFLKVNKETLTEDFAIQINLIDEEGNGAFYIARQGGVCAIEPYDYKDHTAMIDIKTADMVKLIQGKLDVMTALEKGAVKVEGNFEHAKMLATLLPEKKPAPKKTTTKKAAEPKKAAAPKKTTAKKTATKVEKEVVEDVKKDKKPAAKVVKKESNKHESKNLTDSCFFIISVIKC